ncbi:MAG: lytic polysaccharide monooxygenase auxiliary activity family 9 protein, partial [Candidatus Aminicenantes bacterium]|nr:lytic polysaccharide monooxygenase auxiliary activity family 9 protein [Candidatus Aminicenantes bacterium]
TLTLSLEITDAKETKVWTSRQDYALELTEKELAEAISTDYVVEIPLTAPPGDYMLRVEIRSATDESVARKAIPLKIK